MRTINYFHISFDESFGKMHVRCHGNEISKSNIIFNNDEISNEMRAVISLIQTVVVTLQIGVIWENVGLTTIVKMNRHWL